MYQLAPQIRHYPWGSRTTLARLTGRPAPTDQPEAELWVGAHQAASSTLFLPGATGGRTLECMIRSDPAWALGPACAARFGARLPFLLKVLAVEGALSIQCHPSSVQVQLASAGTYPDQWGKPEAVLALTSFEVFAGLRPFRQTQDLFDQLRIPLLTRLIRYSAAHPDPVRALLANLLHLPAAAGRHLAAEVLSGCRRGDWRDPAVPAVLRAALRHPTDIGLVVLLMMRYQVLAPGTLLYLPSGTLHAYLFGTAVEIQANSDNVVRAALTAKPVNVAELLRILDTARHPLVQLPMRSGRTRSWPLRQETHFALHHIGGGAGDALLPGEGSPRVALVLGAPVRLSSRDQALRLTAGQCCFLPATEGPVTVAGPGDVYLAGPGMAVTSAAAVTRRFDGVARS